jgi:hypothetical protein
MNSRVIRLSASIAGELFRQLSGATGWEGTASSVPLRQIHGFTARLEAVPSRSLLRSDI